MLIRSDASIMLTGSSATISRGRGISARATDTRWSSPPENWWAYFPPTMPRSRPTAWRAAATDRRRLAAALDPADVPGGLVEVCVHGLPAAEGVERVLENGLDRPPDPRRSARAARRGGAAVERHRPADGSSIRRMMRASVVFPDRLADDAEDGRLTSVERERDVVEGLEPRAADDAADGEGSGHPVDREQGGRHAASVPGAPATAGTGAALRGGGRRPSVPASAPGPAGRRASTPPSRSGTAPRTGSRARVEEPRWLPPMPSRRARSPSTRKRPDQERGVGDEAGQRARSGRPAPRLPCMMASREASW